MKRVNIVRLLLILALPLSFATHGSASTLQGKVVEILDGERIAVMSINQPLKVKLVAVAAPIGNQAFSDVAKQHLSDLVSGKFVQVHYTSMNQDGWIAGRVVVAGMDAGSQMIRDGVAWYDKAEAASFSEQDRQMYLGCEQAARKETRGLWSDPAAMAPWEFRRQEAASKNLISRPQTFVAKSPTGGKRQLTNDELFGSLTGAGGMPGAADLGWKTLSPHPGRFTVNVPKDSFEFATAVPTVSGGTAEFNYAIGRRGTKAYLVIWGTGPTDGTSDDRFSDDIANGMAFGINRTVSESDRFEVKKLRTVRLGPYAGWQYKLSAPNVPGTMRVFSRRVGQVREVYALVALNGTEDDRQVQEFLGSLTLVKY